MNKQERAAYMRDYRAKQKNAPMNPQALITRIQNWNTTQQIKKQELGLLPNIWSSNNVGMYRQRFYALQGNETGLDQISREQIVRLSRELFFQLPGIGVASELKGEYVVGNHWDFECKSLNPQWRRAAENWINNDWYNNCCTRGLAYDFKTMLQVLSRTIDMDGDTLMLFVKNNNNYPLLQFVGSHRIGSVTANISGNDGSRVEVNGKEYKAFDGIVYDDMWRPIAYCIKRDDAQVSTVPLPPKDPKANTDIIIPAQNGVLVFNPLVFDKHRGLPCLYSSVLYGLQIQDLDNWLMQIAKMEATIAYIIQNDAGQAPQEYENLLNAIQGNSNANATFPSLEPTVHGVSVVKGPTMQYIKSEGGDLKSFHSDRPSEQIQSYIKTIETKLLSAIGIPHQIVYSPETISGRAVNAVTELVRKSVNNRQTLLRKYAKIAVSYALASAMENGYIPKNYDEDLTSIIDFTTPPEFTLDRNQDNNANLELYKVGLISGETYCKENNDDFNKVSEQRNAEVDRLLTDIEAMKAKHPKMDEATILNLYTQRGTSTFSIKESEETQQKPTPNNAQPI